MEFIKYWKLLKSKETSVNHFLEIMRRFGSIQLIRGDLNMFNHFNYRDMWLVGELDKNRDNNNKIRVRSFQMYKIRVISSLWAVYK